VLQLLLDPSGCGCNADPKVRADERRARIERLCVPAVSFARTSLSTIPHAGVVAVRRQSRVARWGFSRSGCEAIHCGPPRKLAAWIGVLVAAAIESITVTIVATIVVLATRVVALAAAAPIAAAAPLAAAATTPCTHF
jgi:hypothetical protein